MEREHKIRLSFCKGDVVVISFVILLAILIGVVFWMKMGTEEGNVVVIYQEGEKIQEIPLATETEVLIDYFAELRHNAANCGKAPQKDDERG